MSTFTLAISCLTTSSLPWFMDLIFLCNIALYSVRLYFHHQSHPQMVLFLLWLHVFTLSGNISPPTFSIISILGTYWPGEFIFQCPVFLPFHTVHGVLKARILKWFAFSSGPRFVSCQQLGGRVANICPKATPFPLATSGGQELL